jgi:hypothetical protein
LKLENIFTFADDSFVVVEGDATADVDAVIDVIAENLLDLIMDDRFEFHFSVFGTTVYPTGFSYAGPFGSALIVAENTTPNPVTILFDLNYEYALNTSVDNPALEYAYVVADCGVVLGDDTAYELFTWIESNDSREDMGSQSFEVSLLPGQFEGITVFAGVTGDPFGPAVPEPKSWLVGIIIGVMLLGGPRTLVRGQLASRGRGADPVLIVASRQQCR